MKAFLYKEIEKIGIQLNDIQINQFYNYYHLLIEWNKKMNLTAITDYEEVVMKHFIDSLSIVKAFDQSFLHEMKAVIDIGTGAGFPGIPLKIVFSDLEITLLDSLNKRIRFLDEVIKKLDLKKIQSLHGRAEDYAKQSNYRERYDLCVSRAVANLSTLSEYSLPYVKIGGYFISYKSGDIDVELNSSEKAVKILGGKIDKVVRFNLSDTDIKRTMVIIKKDSITNNKYPRKAGMPSKEPLR